MIKFALADTGWTLTTIADTMAPPSAHPALPSEPRFAGFAPYVASINEHGTVAFQAGLENDASGIFCGDGRTVTTLIDTRDGVVRHIFSHPAIDRRGAVSFYAELPSGQQGVFLLDQGQLRILSAGVGAGDGSGVVAAAAGTALTAVGPLGPTMNDAGQVAFRADNSAGCAGVYLGRATACATVALSDERFVAFHGLPVVNRSGQVVFRADRSPTVQGIYVATNDSIRTVVETGEQFVELAPFPMMNDAGAVLFGAIRPDGGAGIFMAENGFPVDGGPVRYRTLADTAAGFQSVRGALINRQGMVVYYATPVDGTLGIYFGPDPLRHRLLSIGDTLGDTLGATPDTLFGARIEGFALNPVSVNESGQVAIRLALDDGRQLIVRADPPGAGFPASG